MKTAYLKTDLGPIKIKGNEKGLVAVQFMDASENYSSEVPSELKNAMDQLTEYFEGNRSSFDLKLSPNGTEFQKKVWNQLQKIPFGKTISYRQMANQLGDPNVIRAAASANGKNPISIIVPCHRVIGSDGSLTGYAGGLHRKKWLLEHESPTKQGVLF
jgi:methylated-DNA-[protein]-cysteine S-methyltransferase